MQACSTHLADLLPEVDRLPSEWALVACGDNKGPQYEAWGQISLKAEDFREAVETGWLEKALYKGKPIASDRVRAIGVLCGEPSGGLLFFDHDGPSCPELILALSQTESLADALPKTVAVTSGRKGRYQLIYRVPEIYWQGVETHKVKTGAIGDDNKSEQVEFRWNGCQSVVVGYHPMTGGYQWKYRPDEVEVAIAPQWMIAQMLKPESVAVTASESKPLLLQSELTDTEWALSYLKAIPPAEDYETWLAVGMALHSVDSGLLSDWDRWSSSAQNYKPGVCDRKWKSFKRSGSGIGTLGYLAKRNGWKTPETATRTFTQRHPGEASAPVASESTTVALKSAVERFRAITDPFEKVLAENQIGEVFKVRGQRLESLVTVQELKNGGKTIFSVGDVTADLFTQIEQRSLDGINPGITCGYHDIDAMTYGFGRGDLIIVAGRPSMGKTSFLMGCISQTVAIHKRPILLFSLEMSKEAIVTRLVSSECQIPTGRLRAGKIADHEWESLSRAMSVVSHLPIHIDDTPGVTIDAIEERSRRFLEEHGTPAAIGLDYLQIMEGLGENRVQELARITRRLKALARAMDCPLFALSQLSRGVESRSDKRPMMSDLRESGSIEQDADLVIMLYRDSYYNPESPDRGIAEVILAKHRNGPTGTVKLLFDEESVRFRNLARRVA